MTHIGHNNGPTLEQGYGFRRYAWTKARHDLLPTLPLPVVRRRVKRAQEIGLDYKTYATVRATTGRDVVALLFSTKALRVFKSRIELPPDRKQKLIGIQACALHGLAVAPVAATQIKFDVLDAAFDAPSVHANWTESATVMAQARGTTPPDAVLLIGDTSTERDWSMAGRLAGYLTAQRFFGDATL